MSKLSKKVRKMLRGSKPIKAAARKSQSQDVKNWLQNKKLNKKFTR